MNNREFQDLLYLLIGNRLIGTDMIAKTKATLLNWQYLANDYAQAHQTIGNQRCHLIGIPLIVLAIVQWTQLPAGNPVPLIILFLPLYYIWNIRLGIAMTIVIAIMAIIALFLTAWISLALFIIGWIFQFVGHLVYEKKQPAFTKNLIHLLVGPAWILQKYILKLTV
jgi:uncharacterized membrane protein YGL010W